MELIKIKEEVIIPQFCGGDHWGNLLFFQYCPKCGVGNVNNKDFFIKNKK